ncbi:MAG: hypothetical protein L0271_07320, partial [Gemmatimonadetes bacterium]|nr:hypothetical protein [Gemmatimonadota bacterium]
MARTLKPRPCTNPYLAGIGIGIVLLLAFVLMGSGLGASGAFTAVVGVGVPRPRRRFPGATRSSGRTRPRAARAIDMMAA